MAHTKYIWTNHALKRLKERKIQKSHVEQLLHSPDRTFQRDDGIKELQMIVAKKTVIALVKKNYLGEHIIVSCWINPPNAGTKDFRKRARYVEMKRSSLLKKIWLMFLNKIGL